MSSSLFIFKKIDGYTPEAALESFQRAGEKAGMHCFGFEVYKKETGGEGTLSEKDPETLSSLDTFDWQKEKTFLFGIGMPTELSRGSWTYLVGNPNYFRAINIDNPWDYDDGEFIFRFVINYFEDNPDEYLWLGGSRDWCYTAADIKKLSVMPYDPMWCVKKLV